MLNYIWFGLLAISFIVGAFTGTMAEINSAIFTAAKAAVTVSLGLVGSMALWLGVMRVAQDAGMMQRIARIIRPVMVRLFPDVPASHPAMGAMIMNISANILGLGNAATPFGVKAMKELDSINPRKGVATDAMALFLAINTSNVTLLPLGVITIRASLNSKDPACILLSTLFATICSTICAIILAKIFCRIRYYSLEKYPKDKSPEEMAAVEQAEVPTVEKEPQVITSRRILVLLGLATYLVGLILYVIHAAKEQSTSQILSGLASNWLIPLILVGLISYGFVRGIKVYDSLIAGAKEGFDIAIKIIPFLVAIMVAVAMFRASGCLGYLQQGLAHVFPPDIFPAEAFTMAILRPLSGSGAQGFMTETLTTLGPDSYTGLLVSTINGCSETTFYVLAVYFGAVGITKIRHSLWPALLADLAGVIAAVVICQIMFV